MSKSFAKENDVHIILCCSMDANITDGIQIEYRRNNVIHETLSRNTRCFYFHSILTY